MALVPSRGYSDSAAASTVLELKKGSKQALGEFVWQNQERFYCIAFIGTLDPEAATQLTISAFTRANSAIKQVNPKQLSQGHVWEWLAQFVVDEIGDWHGRNSGPSAGPHTDPQMDGSTQMDWETTVILGAQRVKRCITGLPEEQKKAFILRHQLGLTMEQVSVVLNEHPENVSAWLHRARVQVVKCLGRG